VAFSEGDDHGHQDRAVLRPDHHRARLHRILPHRQDGPRHRDGYYYHQGCLHQILPRPDGHHRGWKVGSLRGHRLDEEYWVRDDPEEEGWAGPMMNEAARKAVEG
jgi:hypothetical protein